MRGPTTTNSIDTQTKEVQAALNRLLETSDLTDQQRHWVLTRWRDEAVWMFRLSMRLRIRFTRVRILATCASLATPVVAGIGINDGALGVTSRILAVAFGVIGAATLATDQILRDGVRWRLYRATFDVLAREGWSYFGAQDKYAIADVHERFALFFASVEEAISNREDKYLVEVAGVVDRPVILNESNTP